MKNQTQMQQHWEERLSFLSELDLPDALLWSDTNLPKARRYIEDTYSEVTKAIVQSDDYAFDRAVERYEKAWVRLWQVMAKEHYESRDILQVDMRYYRHMPDGYSFVLESKVLGGDIIVFPRKPKTAPATRWMTAGEWIQLHENPSMMKLVTEMGAWFSRGKLKIVKASNTAEKASKARAKKIAENGTGLKFKGNKRGWDVYG